MGARCCAKATVARRSVQIRMCFILAETCEFGVEKIDASQTGNGGLQDLRVHLEYWGTFGIQSSVRLGDTRLPQG